MSNNQIYKLHQKVYIPDSNLGSKYGAGEIVALYNDTMSVDFSGHLGKYTISKHTIIPAEILGLKVILDETVPAGEVHLKFDSNE